jgi:hypothetical protein
VFARHDSVATPALLPDGRTAEASISPVVGTDAEERNRS